MSAEKSKAVTRPHATENDIISMAYDLYGLKVGTKSEDYRFPCPDTSLLSPLEKMQNK